MGARGRFPPRLAKIRFLIHPKLMRNGQGLGEGPLVARFQNRCGNQITLQRKGVAPNKGGARNFPTGGLTIPTRGLKYGFQSIVNAKHLRQTSFSPSDGGLTCSERGL